MGATLISFLFAIGAATWIYTKFQRSGGNENSRQSITAACIAGIIIFLVLLVIFNMLFD